MEKLYSAIEIFPCQGARIERQIVGNGSEANTSTNISDNPAIAFGDRYPRLITWIARVKNHAAASVLGMSTEEKVSPVSVSLLSPPTIPSTGMERDCACESVASTHPIFPTSESQRLSLRNARSRNKPFARAQIAEDAKALTRRLEEQRALNLRTIKSKIDGHLSDEDFRTMKISISEEMARIEETMRSLDAEKSSYRDLMQQAESADAFRFILLAQPGSKSVLMLTGSTLHRTVNSPQAGRFTNVSILQETGTKPECGFIPINLFVSGCVYRVRFQMQLDLHSY